MVRWRLLTLPHLCNTSVHKDIPPSSCLRFEWKYPKEICCGWVYVWSMRRHTKYEQRLFNSDYREEFSHFKRVFSYKSAFSKHKFLSRNVMVEYLVSDWLPRFGLSDFRIPYHGLQVFQLSSKFIWPGCLDKEAQHGAGLVKVFLLFPSVTFYRSCSQFTLTSHLQDFSACKKKNLRRFFLFLFLPTSSKFVWVPAIYLWIYKLLNASTECVILHIFKYDVLFLIKWKGQYKTWN